jgi:GNAT superfamily N-acetyltransferase
MTPVRSRDLPATRSNLAIDAEDTEVIHRADHLVLHTPARRSYWDGNVLVLDEAPAAPGDPPERWSEALSPWWDTWASSPLAGDPVRLRWESTDRRQPKGLPAGVIYSQDTTLELGQLATLERPPPPVSCRPAISDEDWRALTDMVLGADDGLPADYVEWAYAKARRAFARTGSAWWTAWDADQLVGSLGLFRGADLWRFQEVETRASHRGRGVASLLVTRALGAWTPERPAYVVAETGEPPERMYQRLGFTPVSWVHTLRRGR